MFVIRLVQWLDGTSKPKKTNKQFKSKVHCGNKNPRKEANSLLCRTWFVSTKKIEKDSDISDRAQIQNDDHVTVTERKINVINGQFFKTFYFHKNTFCVWIRIGTAFGGGKKEKQKKKIK